MRLLLNDSEYIDLKLLLNDSEYIDLKLLLNDSEYIDLRLLLNDSVRVHTNPVHVMLKYNKINFMLSFIRVYLDMSVLLGNSPVISPFTT